MSEHLVSTHDQSSSSPDIRPGLTEHPTARWIIPGVILGVGLLSIPIFEWLRPVREVTEAVVQPEAVQVLPIVRDDVVATVAATGNVYPHQQVSVVPEVAGRVIFVSPQLKRGGRIKQGEVIAKIDDRDYRLAVTQAESRVSRAQLGLSVEEAQRATVEKSWELSDTPRPDSDSLALRAPQLRSAMADLEAARASLEQAKLALARTRMVAPFDAVVLEDHVDVGQVVGAGQPTAVLASSNLFQVRAWVSVDALPHISIPGIADATEGSTVTLRQHLHTSDPIERQGTVTGIGGQLDPQTRTAELLIDVPSPLDPPDGGLPLLVGAFVELEIAGHTLSQAIQIPRTALHNGHQVWTVDQDERLELRTVTLGWRGAEKMQITSGLETGDRLVVSPLAVPAVGIEVRIETTSDEAADE